MLHLAMVRSPFAHAKITTVDVERGPAGARRRRRVHRPRLRRGAGLACPTPGRSRRTWSTPAHPPIAVDQVNYAGEIVAVVVARSRPRPRDAAELVDVDYDELPAVLDIEEAVARGRRTSCHADLGTNKSCHFGLRLRRGRHRRRRRARRSPARADGIVIERRFRQQRLIPAFMEPRSVVVDPTGEQITMWSATQMPHILRFDAGRWSPASRSPRSGSSRPDVGGGFGGKLQVTPEELITLPGRPAARQAGQVHRDPQRVADDARTTAATRSRTSTLAADRKDGTVTGLKVELLADMGAYLALVSAGRPDARRVHVQRDLQVPGLPVRLHRRASPTRRWTDAYRGAGRPEATFAIERMMDELAAELGMDPLEVREQELDQRTRSSRSPRSAGPGVRLAATTRRPPRRRKELFGYDELRAEQQRRRESNDPVQLGIGVSTFTEMCGLAPSPGARLARLRRRRLGARASIRMLPTGKVEVVTGVERRTARATRRRGARSSPTGSACRSRTSRCCTATPQISPKGLDTYGSRSLVVGGEAVVKAADKVIEKAKRDRGAPARGQRGRPRVRRRPVRRPGHRPGRGASRRSRWRRSRRTTCPDGRRAVASTPTRPSTR